MRGSVVHCSRFGCIVRLEDGRLAMLPASERGVDIIKRALGVGNRPQFPFVIAEENGRRIRVTLATPSHVAGGVVAGATSVVPNAPDATVAATTVAGTSSVVPNPPSAQRFSSSLEQKIIDFWRQVSEWDRNAGRVDEEEPALRRADRLRPFEERAPRQYRDTKKRPRRHS